MRLRPPAIAFYRYASVTGHDHPAGCLRHIQNYRSDKSLEEQLVIFIPYDHVFLHISIGLRMSIQIVGLIITKYGSRPVRQNHNFQ